MVQLDAGIAGGEAPADRSTPGVAAAKPGGDTCCRRLGIRDPGGEHPPSEDEPERHRGVVVRLQDSVSAPPADALRLVPLDAPDGEVGAFRVAYLRHLRALWRTDPGAFPRLIERTTGGDDLTLVDDFGHAAHAPRRILGAALKQLAESRRDEARRKTRRLGQPPPRRAPPAAS